MKITGAETSLEQEVQSMINDLSDEDPETWLGDLMQHGCQSGMVKGLVYYTDTTAFYQRHQSEIDAMLKELCDDCGCTPSELFGDKWDDEDFFAREELNQNLLAWFGFEETARRLAQSNGIEA